MVVSSSPEESKGSGDSTTFDEGIRARFWAAPKILGYATFLKSFKQRIYFWSALSWFRQCAYLPIGNIRWQRT